MTPARVVLLAGPSGSGKSRVARLSGATRFRLDDFYRDHDAPGLPRLAYGIDWDHPDTWDGAAALAALRDLVSTGAATVPSYDIGQSRRLGSQTITLATIAGEQAVVVAEGIFAVELLEPARAAGLEVRGIWLDRPRLVNLWFRARRDLRTGRKPWPMLLRRWADLYRAEPVMRRRHLAAGFEPLSPTQCLAVLACAKAGRCAHPGLPAPPRENP